MAYEKLDNKVRLAQMLLDASDPYLVEYLSKLTDEEFDTKFMDFNKEYTILMQSKSHSTVTDTRKRKQVFDAMYTVRVYRMKVRKDLENKGKKDEEGFTLL